MNRCYQNNFPTDSTKSIFDPISKKLIPEISEEIVAISNRLVEILERNSFRPNDRRDCSVYTGKAGFALLYHVLASKDKRFLNEFAYWTEESLKPLRKRDVTFLCGDIGPLCMAAILRCTEDRLRESQEFITEILSFSGRVIEENPAMPSELLYGRVGYLYGLLFLQKTFPNLSTPLPIEEVTRAVITAGLTGQNPPLMWNWHGKEYLGAAHGVAGILYLLLEAKEVLTNEDLLLIKQTLDYIISLRFKSGNLPSSIGNPDDRLVHWCHGAPGFVQVLLKAYEVWKDDVYLQAALQCGEVVWQRGLLKKGYGLCHGVAGNGYTFLALFQATHDQMHLHRAVQFAKWCGTYEKNQERPPDRPFSFFEGLAGTVYFLYDILDPLNALFPAYSISPFKNK